MEAKWFAREYEAGDESAIGALWRAAFPDDDEVGRTELEYWNWQYRDPPAGFARIRVAVADGRIVGHYAVIPVAMQVEGKHVCGTLSLDTMTHPDCQRQGILTKLASEVYDELGRAGLPITYGFPNENSVGALTKTLGWHYVCALRVYVKPLHADVIAERLLPGGLLGSMAKPLAHLGATLIGRPSSVPEPARNNMRWLERFSSDADELWQAVYNRSKIALTRNADFLNWRYPQNPLRGYRILAYEEQGQLLAYAVLRCMEQFGLRGGMIVDLVGHPTRDDALATVLAAAEEYFRQEDMDLAACLMHGDRRTVQSLRRSGFLPAPGRAFKEWHFCVRLNDSSTDADCIADADRWYVTFGDTDVI